MNDSTTQKPETVKMSDYMQNKPIDQTPVTNATTLTSASSSPVLTTSSGMGSDSVKPKNKLNIKFILGAFVLLLVIIGAAAGLYLTQFSQDVRQQAYDSSICAPFAPFATCDLTPSTPENPCTGQIENVSCIQGYNQWRCGNKNWIPNYENPNANCGGCPWPLTNGQCCPAGVDACNPDTDNYICVADPFVAQCEDWNNSACPANQQGYWHAIAWCNTPGCECGPNGLFSDYSGPGCECGGNGIQCNDQCDSTAECEATNPAWSCLPGGDGFNRCRLTSNPSSATCSSGGGGLTCNSSCTVGGTQCQAVNSAWFCDPASQKCRLQSNPSNTSCQTGTTTYQCNSDCTTTAQCQGSLGSAYSCVTNKCRLTANPTSPTCTPATALICNDVCTSSSQCPSGTQCMDSYDFSAAFTNVTANVSSVGSGTITGFKSFASNGKIAQYLVRGGKIWYRPDANIANTWTDATANVTSIGSGTITSFTAYVNSSGATEQWLTRGGKIWHRPNLTASFTDVTGNVTGVGSGTINSYNVNKYAPGHGNIVSASLIRGGKVWNHTSSNWSLWTDSTSNLNAGTGEITDIGFHVNTNGSIRHHYVRGGQIWYREAPLTAVDRCRLPAYPNSGSCTPPSGSLQCDSACTTTAQCAAVNPAWSCVSNKCRLTANPTSATCTPATVYQCNSDCTTSVQCQGSLGANYSCVTNKCRLTANPTSPTCTPATVYQCNSDCTTTAQCQGSLGTAYSCVTNKCRLTANPTSATCTPAVGPMCKDVAILDKDNNELDPKAVPSSFFISQVIKLRCAPDNLENPLIQKYQFRITEPTGKVIEGTALNPIGTARVSLPYTIKENGSFKAQCRICLTDGTCQTYTDIMRL